VHGHNYIIEVWVYGPLNSEGMVQDFSSIKKAVMAFDHTNLNIAFAQPTAETLAGHLAEALGTAPVELVRIRVWEDRDSYAEAEWTP
jgi:6-pyruvoyl-tetrahydropterin synthase